MFPEKKHFEKHVAFDENSTEKIAALNISTTEKALVTPPQSLIKEYFDAVLQINFSSLQNRLNKMCVLQRKKNEAFDKERLLDIDV